MPYNLFRLIRNGKKETPYAKASVGERREKRHKTRRYKT